MSAPREQVPQGRLLSLDVMRGLTMMSMVLVNNPGSWSHVYPPLLHASWHGCTFTDLIFPFFLFMVGVAMPFSFEKRLAQGVNPNALLPRIFYRTAILFGLGMLLGIIPRIFHTPIETLESIRILGVLQRIALCYLAVSLMVLYLKTTGRIIAGAALILVYSLGMWFFPVPNYGANVWEPTGNLCWWIDSQLLAGHTWDSPSEGFDPEGIWSTLTAIVSTLFGYFAGVWIRSSVEAYRKLSILFLFGFLSMTAGYCLSPLMPINKYLWTPSYLFLVTGLALFTLGFLYYVIDMRQWQKGLTPFLVFGTNAIFAYTLSSAGAAFLGYYGIKSWVFQTVYLSIASPINASLLYGLSYVLLTGLITCILYRKKIFLRF